ncbi:MAG: hypothetical protein Q8R45_01315 [Brevundimonas sp.]|nr:hypothetical protein [Brevundimonas sp.]MDP3655591.1 hypothetical protein [Brevundimonas sp.]
MQAALLLGVPATAVDTDALDRWVGFKSVSSVIQGVEKFVARYRDHYEPNTAASAAAMATSNAA